MGTATKAAIVTRALEIVNNTSIQARGELWADLLLDEMARTHRWPELQKLYSGSIGDGTQVVSWPSAYGFLIEDKAGSIGTITDSAGVVSNVYLKDGAEILNDPTRTTSNKGTTIFVGDDYENSRWLLAPISNIAATLKLTYQAFPAAGAGNAVTWFSNDLALVEAIRALAEQYMHGNLVKVAIAIQQQARRLALASPRRARMFTGGGPGSGLDPRWFRR